MAYPATPSGSPTYVASATGFGQAVSLNGSDQYFTIEGEVMHPPGGSTWTIRARFKTTSSSGIKVIFGNPAVGFIGLNDGKPFANPTGSGYTGITGVASVADDIWHEMELNVGASSAALYVNGVAVGAQSGTYSPGDSGVWQLSGGAPGVFAAFPFPGLVDEVALFNSIQHTSNYTPRTSPIPNGSTGLAGLYHLDNNGDDSAEAGGAESFSIAESSVDPHTTGVVLTLTGLGTSWDGSTVFSVSGLPGTAKTAQNVDSSTSATVTLTTGTVSGTLTVSDGASEDDVEVLDRKTIMLTISGVDMMVIEPASYEGAATKLVFYHHGNGETRTAWNDEALKHGLRDRMLSDGHLIAGISAGATAWGNDSAMASYSIAHPYLLANWNVSLVCLYGQSMGGLTALRAIVDSADYAKVAGGYFIYPCCSPLAEYDDGQFQPQILSAWSSADRTDLVAALDGKDPLTRASSDYPNVRYRFRHSPGDTVVFKDSNTDAMRSILGETSTQENSLVVTSGNHGDASNFDPDNLSDFVASLSPPAPSGNGRGTLRIGYTGKFGVRFVPRVSAAPVDPLAGIPFALRLQTHRPGSSVPVGLYQDTACTIPATQDGDPIAAWRDELSDSGIIAVQSDIQKQPILFFQDGIPTVLFDGIDDCFIIEVNTTGPTSWGIGVLNDSGSAAPNQRALGFFSPGEEDYNSTETIIACLSLGATGNLTIFYNNSTAITASAPDNSFHSLSARKSNTQIEAIIDGVMQSTAALAGALNSNRVAIATQGDTGFSFWSGQMTSVFISPVFYSDIELSLVEYYIASLNP